MLFMKKYTPYLVLSFSVFVVAFLLGIYSAVNKKFPYPLINEAVLTFKSIAKTQWASKNQHIGKIIETTKFPASDSQKLQWTIFDRNHLSSHTIAHGGLNQYLNECPFYGCIAVEFDKNRNIVKSWPYKPKEIFSQDITNSSFPHETLGFNAIYDVYPVGVKKYSNEDILVTFQARTGRSFPFGMGVSRIQPDGTPRWTRFDYSHHWPTLDSNENAYVPNLKIGKQNIRFTQGSDPSPRKHTLKCSTDKPLLDSIAIIDADGEIIEEIDLIPIIINSNWTGLLPETTDPCDPLHLNYIDIIQFDAGEGLARGDLILSLRNLSRFVVFDPIAKEIKRVIAGGFLRQHSVQHLRDSKFLIFDNRGADSLGPASRIIEIDLATGIERRIFPTSHSSDKYSEVFSDTAGFIDISPDRKRVMASFTHAGKAFEIDIETGKLLSVFDNLHNLSSLSELPATDSEFATRYSLYGMGYLIK